MGKGYDICFLGKFCLNISAILMLAAVFYMQAPGSSSTSLGIIIIIVLSLILLSIGAVMMRHQQVNTQLKV